MKKPNEPADKGPDNQDPKPKTELDPELIIMLKKPKDVMYILSWGAYIRVFTLSRGKLEFRGTIREAYKIMPKTDIILGHRSNIINIRYVMRHYAEGDGLCVEMTDGANLRVTEAMKKRFKKKAGL